MTTQSTILSPSRAHGPASGNDASASSSSASSLLGGTEQLEAEMRAASRGRAGSEREAVNSRLSEDDAAPSLSSSSGAATPVNAPSGSSKAAAAIPTSFMQSLGAWWSSSESEAAESERRLLRRMPFFTETPEEGQQDVAGGDDEDAVIARIKPVYVGRGELKGKAAADRYINTLKFTTRAIERKVAETPLLAQANDKSTTTDSTSPRDAVVLLHGYGAGLGFFYLNWSTIAHASASQGLRSYALDWLGMGRSGRPSPSELNAGKKATVEERVKKAERFFTESLEQWRVKEGVERMTLIGHSLGGYLSLAYALEYPDRVNRLVLLSPAGIPHGPEDPGDGRSATNAAKQETKGANSAARNAARELTEPQQETQQGAKDQVNHLQGASSTANGNAQVSSSQAAKGASADKTQQSRSSSPSSTADDSNSKQVPDPKGPPRRVRQAITYLWDSGLSPFSLIRGLGPWGPMMVGRYSSRRFGSLSEDDTRDMHHYIWTISRAKGSSEHCISHLLAPGAYARMPMVDRVHSLRVPVTFSYGDRDWMDPQGGIDAVARMKAAGNPHGKVVMIKNAGHHLYLDNATRSNQFLQEEIAAIRSGKS